MFAQTWRSGEVTPSGHPAGTAIYYLLTDEPDSFSEMHRLPTVEVFHYYLGDSLEGLLLHPGGRIERVTLGAEVLAGQHVQFSVPAGVWQGWRVAPGGAYALVGTTMAPGYIDADYERGDRRALLRDYPAAAQEILTLTRE